MLKEASAGEDPHEVFSFTNANIINYLVVRTVVDGMPANNMKALNSRVLNLFWSGYIQYIRTRTDKHKLKNGTEPDPKNGSNPCSQPNSEKMRHAAQRK